MASNAEVSKKGPGVLSPDGQFERSEEQLGEGSFKRVYKAIDTQEGTTVAWNEVDIEAVQKSEKRRIIDEVNILQQVKHERIMDYVASWYDKENHRVVIITEILTEGTLKEFTQRIKTIRLRIVRKWCRQILEGLDYLHNLDPPVIHRDLKCDNIFINERGDIKIGDLGLSKRRGKSDKNNTVLGTPQFMAPELFEENYDETVDVYAFGMALLEMVSKESPYDECSSVVKIIHRITSGIPPEVLKRVTHDDLRDFISFLITRRPEGAEKIRPSAAECLQHAFLVEKEEDGDVFDLVRPLESAEDKTDLDGKKGAAKGKAANSAAVPSVQEGDQTADAPARQGTPAVADAPGKDQDAAGSDNSEKSPLDSDVADQTESVGPRAAHEANEAANLPRPASEPAGRDGNGEQDNVNMQTQSSEAVEGQSRSPRVSLLNPEDDVFDVPIDDSDSKGEKKKDSGRDPFFKEMQAEYNQSIIKEKAEKLEDRKIDDVIFGALNQPSNAKKAEANGANPEGSNVPATSQASPETNASGGEHAQKGKDATRKTLPMLAFSIEDWKNGSRYLPLRMVTGSKNVSKHGFDFNYDLIKDEPFELASSMAAEGLCTEGELVDIARLLCRLRDKHKYLYAMKNTQKDEAAFNLFKDSPTPKRPVVRSEIVAPPATVAAATTQSAQGTADDAALVVGTKAAAGGGDAPRSSPTSDNKVEQPTAPQAPAALGTNQVADHAGGSDAPPQSSPRNAEEPAAPLAPAAAASGGAAEEKAGEEVTMVQQMKKMREGVTSKVAEMKRAAEETTSYVEQKLSEIQNKVAHKETEMVMVQDNQELYEALKSEQRTYHNWIGQLERDRDKIDVSNKKISSIGRQLAAYDERVCNGEDEGDEYVRNRIEQLREKFDKYTKSRQHQLEKAAREKAKADEEHLLAVAKQLKKSVSNERDSSEGSTSEEEAATGKQQPAVGEASFPIGAAPSDPPRADTGNALNIGIVDPFLNNSATTLSAAEFASLSESPKEGAPSLTLKSSKSSEPVLEHSGASNVSVPDDTISNGGDANTPTSMARNNAAPFAVGQNVPGTSLMAPPINGSAALAEAVATEMKTTQQGDGQSAL
jgi:serine/threonine protein kinase